MSWQIDELLNYRSIELPVFVWTVNLAPELSGVYREKGIPGLHKDSPANGTAGVIGNKKLNHEPLLCANFDAVPLRSNNEWNINPVRNASKHHLSP